jgi:iron complex transport system substrate-binding protein
LLIRYGKKLNNPALTFANQRFILKKQQNILSKASRVNPGLKGKQTGEIPAQSRLLLQSERHLAKSYLRGVRGWDLLFIMIPLLEGAGFFCFWREIMNKYLGFTALLLAISISAMACAPASPSVQIEDDLGTPVYLDRPVQRIISLAPSSTEMVYYLGLEDRLIGDTEYCNYPPAANNKTRVGGFSTVDMEKVVSLQPDLALAADIHSKSATPMLQKMGFRVVTFSPKTLDRVINDLGLLAKICGITDKSEGTINGFKNRVDAISSKTLTIKDNLKPGVLVVIWHDPMMVAGKGTLVDDLIRLAGGINRAQGVSGYGNLSVETIISSDPDVIIVPTSMGASGNQIWNGIASDARLVNVSAIKNNAVYKIDGDVILRYGPRSVTALEQIAALLHPQLFKK